MLLVLFIQKDVLNIKSGMSLERYVSIFVLVKDGNYDKFSHFESILSFIFQLYVFITFYWKIHNQ